MTSPAETLSAADLAGVTAVTVTPITATNEVDVDAFRTLLRSLRRGGIIKFIVAGHTGEFHSLTIDEWECLVAAACDELRGEGVVIASVGHATTTACRMAELAAEHGCDAALVHEPAHPAYPPVGLVAHIAAIASAGGLPTIPYLSRGAGATDAFRLLEAVEGVIAVKWGVTGIRPDSVPANGSDQAQLTWLCGLGERWAALCHRAGAIGYTSGLANVHPRLAVELADRLAAGQLGSLARRWPAVVRFERLRASDWQSVAVVKAALRRLGHRSTHMRLPLVPLDPRHACDIDQMLAEWGLAPVAAMVET